VCDVGVSNQVEAFAKAVEKDFGQIDVLVNNAGFTKDNLLFLLSEADWDSVVDTNLKGTFLMTKYAARGMIKRRWGRVINITSVVGLNGNKGQSNYSASKAGIIGFTKSVAKELASRNVLVNAVAPGFVETELTESVFPRSPEVLPRQHSAGTAGTQLRNCIRRPLSRLRLSQLHYGSGSGRRRRDGDVAPLPSLRVTHAMDMKQLEEKVKDIIVEELGVERDKLTNDASFMEDLGADSLDTVELVMAFEKEFDIDIPDEEAEKLRTVGAAMNYLHDKMGKGK